MARILILHSSAEGQTETIAGRIADELRQEGHVAELAPISANPPLKDADAVIVGASIHVGQYAKELLDYLKAHRAELERLPNAFFSVCLTAAQEDEASRETVQGYIRKLEDDTLWQPDVTASFAGALKFTKYGFFKRQLMRVISNKGGLNADTSRDHEYTDWTAVAAFAEGFARRLAGTPAAARERLPEPVS